MHNLIKTEEFFKTIDLIVTPVIVANQKTARVYFNEAFNSEIGYQTGEIPTLERWFELAYPDPVYRQHIASQWETELAKSREFRHNHAHLVARVQRADGSHCWYDIHRTMHGDYQVITFLNIDALHKNHEELQETVQQKDILLSIIAHDVRSPLATIRQIVHHYEHMELSADEIAGILSQMDIQIEYIFNIINSLLVRASADRGSFIEKREAINIKEFYSKYTGYYRERLDKQQLKFSMELSGAESIVFDPFILDMISRNLIDNAIKYSPLNGTIYLSFNGQSEFSRICIRDEGPGISDAQSDRILNNQGSRRLENQITDSFGLGLVMAKEILEKHSGRLGIDSTISQGTSFHIDILN
jgi:signal transduction histidine kinase